MSERAVVLQDVVVLAAQCDSDLLRCDKRVREIFIINVMKLLAVI